MVRSRDILPTLGTNLDYVANVRPSPRQLLWQSTEFYGFIHFGMNTFTDREWGDGTDSPELFNPTAVDVDQWLSTMKSAGMKGVILTAKHHDGFCLWPSEYTDYSVASSPWREGNGDLVAEVAESAKRHGLKLGIYLSPWDRHDGSYGQGKAYDDYFVAQLTELLTGYGPVFSVWLDGANGEGPNGRSQDYDWDRYYRVVRSLQPNAAITVCGPDVRWCGNEAGHVRANEWSVVPAGLLDVELIAEKSQQVDDGKFSRLVSSSDEDLGSREALASADTDPIWYPAEVNTSIRPGWFYHASEDSEVRTPEELFDVYCGAVGGNATFLLNLPPNKEGLLADPDCRSLLQLGGLISDFYARQIDASSIEHPSGATQADGLVVTVPAGNSIEAVILGEDIQYGQRIEKATVEALQDGQWESLAAVESVGYRRIVRFEPVKADAIRVTIQESRGEPMLTDFRIVAARS